MVNLRALAVTVTVVGAVAIALAASAGGQSGSGSGPSVEQGVLEQAALDHSLRSCDARFMEFDVGPSMAGMARVHKQVECSDPEPVRTSAAGGEIDPNSLGRAHSVTYIYGTCTPRRDQGCSPPLSIQTWPACERSAADYTMAGQRLDPSEVLEIRGAPARFYGDNRLELSTGEVTVVIFGDSRALLLAAAGTLRTTPDSPTEVGRSGALPAPVPGSQDGTLAC
jgi:hypothetical protein